LPGALFIIIEEFFDINIECDEITNEYYIENIDDYEGNNFTKWQLNSKLDTLHIYYYKLQQKVYQIIL